MKYRRLSQDELLELAPEFIRFLSSQAIPSDEWETLKLEKPQLANELIDVFSDMVFDNIIERIEYLELKTSKDFKTFWCEPDKINMFGILIEGQTDLTFQDHLAPEQIAQLLKESDAKVKVYRGEKSYKKERSQELFDWLEKGALISKDGAMYKTLEQLFHP